MQDHATVATSAVEIGRFPAADRRDHATLTTNTTETGRLPAEVLRNGTLTRRGSLCGGSPLYRGGTTQNLHAPPKSKIMQK